MRELTVPCEIDFMAISSYGRAPTSVVVRILYDLEINISGRDVLVVEDIIDSGLTPPTCAAPSARKPLAGDLRTDRRSGARSTCPSATSASRSRIAS